MCPCSAWLLNGDEQYGVAGPAFTLALGLRERGWRTEFFTLCDGPFSERCRQAGFQVTCLGAVAPRLDQRSHLWHLPSYAIRRWHFDRLIVTRLAQQLRRLGATHLGVRWQHHVEPAGKAARLARIPCYWLMSNVVAGRWPLQLDRRYYRHLCRSYGIIPLANSQYTADTLGGGVGQRVLYLGADEKQFDPENVPSFSRSQLSIPEGAVTIGIFSRLDPDKGHERLWRAMISHLEQGHNLHLLVVGGPADGAVAGSLRELAASSNADDRLHFVGWTPEPQRYYEAIDFGASVRITPEPFGLSVIEGMLMRKPMLVHALGGPAETVIDGVTGWHIPTAEVEHIQKGIQRAIDGRGRWPEFSEAAFRHARRTFYSRTFYQQFPPLRGDKRRRDLQSMTWCHTCVGSAISHSAVSRPDCTYSAAKHMAGELRSRRPVVCASARARCMLQLAVAGQYIHA